ncbi:T9SS type A sorting domain-containing protein [Flavobacterium sp. GCM10027622]|uniref:T9SS type A sorting domain-containing protein n=1 Tax=unclassified Flavobacterium TaxID=196869 RepID=UPI00361946D0
MRKIMYLWFLLHLVEAFSQESVNASGRDISGSNGNVSYSVGQVTYSSYTGSGAVNEGIQLPFEIITLNVNDASVNKEVELFPNPTAYGVNLRINSVLTEELQFVLYDMNGRMLKEGTVAQREIYFPMEHLSASIYFLKVKNSNKELKTFKIIKNQ